MNATYSPEDNKLRLCPDSRLDPNAYSRVKAAGFLWAPKQGLLVAPAWSPSREDLLIDLCGEIGDEDTSLVDRAEQRAERFEEYSERRAEDAERARDAVQSITHNIPIGQPILVGHHSERHARKDAERIESGMRRAVKMWETSQYWESRAKGAIRAAKYKEQPAVRARRIKGLESDLRKHQKTTTELEKLLKFWQQDNISRESALKICNYFDRGGVTLPDGSFDWSAWSALEREKVTLEDLRAQRLAGLPKSIAHYGRWIQHTENRLAYERAMLAESGGTEADRNKPEKGGGCRCWASPRGGWSYIQKVNKVSVTVLDNWGNGGKNFTRTIPFDKLTGIMSAAEVASARADGRLVESADGTGFGLLDRQPPAPAPAPAPEASAAEFEAMRESLRAGVQVVTANQLFPTPPDLARRMVELAAVEPGETVLEPSAGTGNIARAVINAVDTEVLAYEINPNLCAEMRRSLPDWKVKVVCRDFLEVTDFQGCYPVVLMNPPFENGADIKHIRHALTFLKPGGRLVAICANGPRQNEQLRPLADTWEVLPSGTFAGTGVTAALLTIQR